MWKERKNIYGGNLIPVWNKLRVLGFISLLTSVYAKKPKKKLSTVEIVFIVIFVLVVAACVRCKIDHDEARADAREKQEKNNRERQELDKRREEDYRQRRNSIEDLNRWSSASATSSSYETPYRNEETRAAENLCSEVKEEEKFSGPAWDSYMKTYTEDRTTFFSMKRAAESAKTDLLYKGDISCIEDLDERRRLQSLAEIVSDFENYEEEFNRKYGETPRRFQSLADFFV